LNTVAITQRVSIIPKYAERRDCLDQAWPRFLQACGLLPLVLPNVTEVALRLCAGTQLAGIVLTGGNDLAELGGDAPERDAVENALLDMAQQRNLPVLGVCRGMQVIQRRCGVALRRVEGHVTARQTITIDGQRQDVNAYHCFGGFESLAPLRTWAVADDGVVKAIRHDAHPVIGIMWHPERNAPFAATDIALFQRQFLGA
jgi:N5-(cytidine 5'-diphosphoramidyl)-L-glutamine hydrolase